MNTLIHHLSFAVILCALPLAATTNYVCIDGLHTFPYTSWATAATNIQAAIDVAVSGDLVLVSNGVYATHGMVNNAFGFSAIMIREGITVQSLNGSEVTVVDAYFPVWYGRGCLVSTNAVLDGFTLVNGAVMGAEPECYGGGVLLLSNALVRNCTVRSSSADWGGGMACYYGGIVSNCLVTACVATGTYSYGGGVAFYGGGLAIDCVLSNNAAYVYGGGSYARMGGQLSHSLVACNWAAFGGAGTYVYMFGDLDRCIVTGNFCNFHGGGMNINGHGVAKDCRVTDNITSNLGGGIFISGGGIATNCIVTGNQALQGGGGGVCIWSGGLVIDCVIASNTAHNSGGGVGCISSDGTISRCIVKDNHAYGYAGGIELVSNTLVQSCIISGNLASNYAGGVMGGEAGMLRNCLVVGNTSSNAGGIWLNNGGSMESCTVVSNTAINHAGGVYVWNNGYVTNSILYHNTASNGANYGGWPGFVMNASYCCLSPELPGSDNCITDDPQFVDSAAADFRLATNSPCINAGTNFDWMTTAFDLDGQPRISVGRVDMGAYEISTDIVIRVTPPVMDFGIVTIGDSTQMLATIDNLGFSAFAGCVTEVLDPFSLPAGSNYSVAAHGATNIVLSFAPLTAGEWSNTVFFSGDGGTTVLLTGRGVPEPVAGGALFVVSYALLAMSKKGPRLGRG